jgi:hypothetical protein
MRWHSAANRKNLSDGSMGVVSPAGGLPDQQNPNSSKMFRIEVEKLNLNAKPRRLAS